MVYVFVLVLLGILYLNKRILSNSYKVLNPVTILSGIWIIVLLLHHLYYGTKPYTFTVYLSVVASIASFAFAFWGLATKTVVFGNKGNFQNTDYNTEYIKKILTFFTLIEICRFVYYSYYIIGVISGGSITFFVNNSTQVRLWYMHSNPGFLLNLLEFSLNSFSMIGYVLVALYLAKGEEKRKTYFLLWTALELFCSIITMSKMSFIIYLLVFTIVYINNKGSAQIQYKVVRRMAPVLFTIIVAFLVYIGYQRNYMAQGKLSEMVFNKAIDYFSGPVEALGVWIDNNKSPLSLGMSTFSIIWNILSIIGIKATSAVQYGAGFIDIGRTSTNVFTWLLPFYKDFSFAGFIIMPLILGCIAGILYNQYKHNIFIDTCNAWISALLAMSFFDFMWSQTIYVFIIVLSFFIHKTFGKKLYVCEG